MIKRAAILVHGFNVSDGGMETVGTLRPFLQAEGVVPILVDYGYFGLIRVKFGNRRVAAELFDAVMNAYSWYDEVYVIGHSNGCVIAHLASRMRDFKCDGFVYINPALRKDLERDSSVKFIHVWHSPSDLYVMIAKNIPFLSNWGEMGAKGYQGIEDSNIVNLNKEDDYMEVSDEHSDVFHYSKRPYFAPRIVGKMLSHYDPTV